MISGGLLSCLCCGSAPSRHREHFKIPFESRITVFHRFIQQCLNTAWVEVITHPKKLKVKHRRRESLCEVKRRRGRGTLQTLYCLHWMLMHGEAAAHSYQSVWKHKPECVSDSPQSWFHSHKHAAIRRHWVHETRPPVNPPPNPHTFGHTQ